MLALAEVGERGCWALSAVTRKGGCMPHMYVDPYAILDVTYLVAAFLFDGHGEDDGEYMIGCVLDLGDAVERVALVYPTQQSRDRAFVEIGWMVTAYEAEQAALDEAC